MNNSCEYYEELCSAAIDHALTPAEQKELDAHLAACPSCRAYLEQLQEMQKMWKELEVPMPTALHEKIMGEIEAEAQKTVVQTPPKSHRRPPVFTMLAAAAACVMLAVSGNLTGLFGQLGTTSSIPTESGATESPSTAEALPKTEQQSENQLQAKLQEQASLPEQTLEPDQSAQQSEQQVQNEPEPAATEPQTTDTPQTQPQSDDTPTTTDTNQTPETPSTIEQEPATPRMASQAPVESNSDSTTQSQTDVGASPRVAMYSVGASLPRELKDMSFAKCFTVTADAQHTDAALPVISGMTLLIEQDGIAYYSVENNESKITEVQQELEKNGYQTTLNESSGVAITLEAKKVLFIVE